MFESLQGTQSGYSGSYQQQNHNASAGFPTTETVFVSINNDQFTIGQTNQGASSTKQTMSPGSSLAQHKIVHSVHGKGNKDANQQRKWLQPQMKAGGGGSGRPPLTMPATHGFNSNTPSSSFPSTSNLMSTIHAIQKPQSTVLSSRPGGVVQREPQVLFSERNINDVDDHSSNLNFTSEDGRERASLRNGHNTQLSEPMILMSSGCHSNKHSATARVSHSVGHRGGGGAAGPSSFNAVGAHLTQPQQPSYNNDKMNNVQMAVLRAQPLTESSYLGTESNITSWRANNVQQHHQAQRQEMTPVAEYSPIIPYKKSKNAKMDKDDTFNNGKSCDPTPRSEVTENDGGPRPKSSSQMHQNVPPQDVAVSSAGTLTISQVNLRAQEAARAAAAAGGIRFRDLKDFDSDRNNIATGNSEAPYYHQQHQHQYHGRNQMLSPATMSNSTKFVSNLTSAGALISPSTAVAQDNPTSNQQRRESNVKMVDTYRMEDQPSFQERLNKMQVDIQRTSRLLEKHKQRQGEAARKWHNERQRAAKSVEATTRCPLSASTHYQQQAIARQQQQSLRTTVAVDQAPLPKAVHCQRDPSQPKSDEDIASQQQFKDWNQLLNQQISAKNQMLEEMASSFLSEKVNPMMMTATSQQYHQQNPCSTESLNQRAPRFTKNNNAEFSPCRGSRNNNGSFMKKCGLVTSSFDNQYGADAKSCCSHDRFGEGRPSSKRDQKITYSKTSLDEIQFMQHFNHIKAIETEQASMPLSAVKQTPLMQKRLASGSQERRHQMDIMSTLHKRSTIDGNTGFVVSSQHTTLPSRRRLNQQQQQQQLLQLSQSSNKNQWPQSAAFSGAQSVTGNQPVILSTQHSQRSKQTTTSLQQRLDHLNHLLGQQNLDQTTTNNFVEDVAVDGNVEQTLNSSTEKALEYLGRRGELFIEENNLLDNTINLEQLHRNGDHQQQRLESGWSQRLHSQPDQTVDEGEGEAQQFEYQQQQEGDDENQQLFEILQKIGISEAHIWKFQEQEIGLYDFMLLTKEDLIELELPIAVRNRIMAFQKHYQNEGMGCSDDGALTTDFNMTDIIRQVTRGAPSESANRSTCFNNTQLTMQGRLSKMLASGGGPCDLIAVQERNDGDILSNQRRPRTAMERTYQGNSSKLKYLQEYRRQSGSVIKSATGDNNTDDDYGLILTTAATSKPGTTTNMSHALKHLQRQQGKKPPRVSTPGTATTTVGGVGGGGSRTYNSRNHQGGAVDHQYQHVHHFQSAMTQMAASPCPIQEVTPTDSCTVSTNGATNNNAGNIRDQRRNKKYFAHDDFTDTTRPNALTTTPTVVANEHDSIEEPSSRTFTDDGGYGHGNRHRTYNKSRGYDGRMHTSTINTLSTSQIAASRNSIAAQRQSAHTVVVPGHHLDTTTNQSKKKRRRSKRKSVHKKQAKYLYKELKRLILRPDGELCRSGRTDSERKVAHNSSVQSLLLENIAQKMSDPTLSNQARTTMIKRELKKLVRVALKKQRSSLGQQSMMESSDHGSSVLERAVGQWAQHELVLSQRGDTAQQILSHAEDIEVGDSAYQVNYDHTDDDVVADKYKRLYKIQHKNQEDYEGMGNNFESTHDFAKHLYHQTQELDDKTDTILSGLADNNNSYQQTTTNESERETLEVPANVNITKQGSGGSLENQHAETFHRFDNNPASYEQLNGKKRKVVSPHGQTYSFGFVASNAQIMNSDERASLSRATQAANQKMMNASGGLLQAMLQQSQKSQVKPDDYLEALKQMQRSGQIGSLGLGGINLDKIQSHLQRLTMSPSATETRPLALDPHEIVSGSETEPETGSGRMRHEEKKSVQNQSKDSASFWQQQYTFAGRPQQSHGQKQTDNRKFGNMHLQQLQSATSFINRSESLETEKPFQEHSDVSQRNKQLLEQAKKDIEALNSKAAAFKNKLEIAKKEVILKQQQSI